MLEFLKGSLVIALGGGDAVLETGEDLTGIVAEGAAQGVDVFIAVAGGGAGDIQVPELGFRAAEPAEGPFGVDEDVDEACLLYTSRCV